MMLQSETLSESFANTYFCAACATTGLLTWNIDLEFPLTPPPPQKKIRL